MSTRCWTKEKLGVDSESLVATPSRMNELEHELEEESYSQAAEILLVVSIIRMHIICRLHTFPLQTIRTIRKRGSNQK